MIRHILFLLISLQPILLLGQYDIKNLEKELDLLLDKEEQYHQIRLEKINKLKNNLLFKRNSTQKSLFDIHYQLFEQYQKFQSDSALTYIYKCQEIIGQENDSLRIKLQLDLAHLYSTKGRYLEANEILKNISPQTIPVMLLAKYYDTYLAFYSHYGQSNNNNIYYRQSELYRDSLLQYLDPNAISYQIEIATRDIFAGNRKKAIEALEYILQNKNNTGEYTALVSYLLGIAYKQENNPEKQKYYVLQSAIEDIKNANKDNASLQDLALIYYGEENFDRAFKLIDKAIKDAIYCDVRYRIIEGTTFYPIINASYQAKINAQNKKLLFNLVLISVLTVVLIAGIIFIIKQMNKLSLVKSQLSQTNNQLLLMNTQIHKSNIELSEANHIKEEYIAQFFDMCSSYIEKIDLLRKRVIKKANTNQLQDLITELKSPKLIEDEVIELYHNFDTIFLNLYPSFIEDFNSLLREEEIILPKKNELLNTELRIFALIRLGIDDSVKIASFLRYSLRTVYNYRTKVRNKAIGDREEFENLVKKIGNIDRK